MKSMLKKIVIALFACGFVGLSLVSAQRGDPTGGEPYKPETSTSMEEPAGMPTGDRSMEQPVSNTGPSTPPKPTGSPSRNSVSPSQGSIPPEPTYMAVPPRGPFEERNRPSEKPSPSAAPAQPLRPTPTNADVKREADEARGKTPEPVRDQRADVKDVKETREGGQDAGGIAKEKGSAPDLPAPAIEAIAKKLNITPNELKNRLESGEKLRDLVKGKINPEEMKRILPPKKEVVERVVEEKGFFGKLRASIFGPRKETFEQSTNEFGEVTTTPVPQKDSDKPFWRRILGW